MADERKEQRDANLRGRDWPNLLLMDETPLTNVGVAGGHTHIFRIELDTVLEESQAKDVAKYLTSGKEGDRAKAIGIVLAARDGKKPDDFGPEAAFVRAAFRSWDGTREKAAPGTEPVLRDVEDYGGPGGSKAEPRRWSEVVIPVQSGQNPAAAREAARKHLE